MSPSLYIIAGPNGVGKTTFAREFLPNYANCRNFINADLIAQGMGPFSPETAAFRAGKLMLTEIDLLAQRRVDFGFALRQKLLEVDWSIEKPGLCRALLLSLAVEC
jgi:predicted ABC-type ATPase